MAICNVIPPPDLKASGILTQKSGTTAYTICPEITYMKSRWIQRGNAIMLSCFYKCVTPSSNWIALAEDIPLGTALIDHNFHPVVHDFETGNVVTNAGALLQTGRLYVNGGIANTTYFVEIVYLTDD